MGSPRSRPIAMNFVRLLPPAVALLLLAAHFARAQAWLLTFASVALVAVLAVPRPWAARLVQTALMLGTIEWLRTLAALVATRMALGQPAVRLGLILGIVAAITLASALVFRLPALRERFRLPR
jgi:hypothetical protein